MQACQNHLDEPLEFVSMHLGGRHDDTFQPFSSAAFNMLKQLPTHARCPELTQVQGNLPQGLFLVRVRLKKVTDLIGHLDEILGVHIVYSRVMFSLFA